MSKQFRSRLVCSVALVVALGGSSAAAASSPPVVRGAVATAEAPVSGSFVGKADGGPQVGVAVVAEQPAAEGQARRISVYVCNGTSLSVWLTGTTPGNEIDLRSTDGRFGAHVIVTALAASGKVGLSGGSGFRFTVRRAVGVAGLFDLTIATNGTLQGASASGARLSGRLAQSGKLAASKSMTVTASAGGQSTKLTIAARHLRPGAYRWIVLPDRTVFGANRRGPGLGGIGGLGTLRPTGGKVVRLSAGSAGQPGYDDDTCGKLATAWNQVEQVIENAAETGTDTSPSLGQLGDLIYNELDDHCLVVPD